MNSENDIKELRLKGSSTILGYLKRFSATEKAVFGIFAIAAIVTAIVMAGYANSYFMTEVPGSGGSLHEGLVGLPHTVNPILAVTDVDRDISALVYAGLTKFKNNKIVPDLASGWIISPDGLTYTFTLRSDLTFQNGTPLTADDVVFTVNKIKDYVLKSPRAGDWAGVTAETVSPTVVKFTLKQPYSSFLNNTTVGILPKSIWGNVSNDQFIFSEYNVKPIGAGPYKIISIKRDQGGIPTEYNLESWNGYHDDRAYITNIIFSFFPDLDHAITALANGSIDSLSSIPPAAAHDLATNKGEPYTIETTPLTRIFGVFFNQNKNPILADAVVRQALNMAIDRDAIVKNVFYGYSVPISGPFPIDFDMGDSIDTNGNNTSLPLQNSSTTKSNINSNNSTLQNLPGAQTLLIKNGWRTNPNGIFEKKASKKSATTTLAFTLYTADTPDLKEVAALVKNQWQKFGASVTVKVFPPTELYQNTIRTRDYDALLFGQVVGKSTDFYAFWHSSQRNSPGLNVSMYTNSKADRLLENIRVATDTASRNTAYRSLETTINEDTPAVFLYSPNLIYAVPKNLKGLDLSLATAPMDRFQFVTDWYLETERVWSLFDKNDLNIINN